jgi:hypothetical protein
MRAMNKIIINISLILLFILSSLKFYQSYDNVLFNAFQKNGGNEVAVYPEVLDIQEIIDNYQIQDFNLDGNLLKGLPLQRIVEFTYPIRLNPSSKNLFLSNTIENNDIALLPSECNLIEEGLLVNLYECV